MMVRTDLMSLNIPVLAVNADHLPASKIVYAKMREELKLYVLRKTFDMLLFILCAYLICHRS